VADLGIFVPIVVALLAGGAVAFYTARPKKDLLIAEAAEKAVAVVVTAIERQEGELRRLTEELQVARERIAVLEAEVARLQEARA
jgi:hypothetical protein